MARSAVIDGEAEVMRRRCFIKNDSCPRFPIKRQRPI